MDTDFIIYKGETFKTGDSISCKTCSIIIPDAKIYVCSEAEIREIWGNNRAWVGLMFVYNNFYESHLGESPVLNWFGYPKVFTTALIVGRGVWSDNVTCVKHIKRDELKSLIDNMILNDKSAIEKKRSVVYDG